LAISGKKVLLMELDLRKPKVSKMLGLTRETGFTNFIISDIPLQSILQPSNLHENLFVIGAGTIPPNPAELILQEKVSTLFEELRNSFDFIIIDTAPVGLVTDALLLSRYADANIYVVRQNYTIKGQLNIINDIALTKKMNNVSILINDVSNKGSYGYGYGYGYGGSGYYADQPEKKSIFKRKK
jgi:capsular exopolysaccharide synthesis family protein